MTKQETPDDQGDALIPAAVATMRELGWTEAQIEAERRNAELIKAAGGFTNWVAMCEAARIASEARGYKVEPEAFSVKVRGTDSQELAELAATPSLGAPPELWAYWIAVEHVERNSGPGYPSLAEHEKCTLRTVVEGQIMRAFEAQAATLPLRQVPTGLPWPKGLPLPPKWSEVLYMEKRELRAWAADHAPDLLGSALLVDSQAASAKQVTPHAGEAQAESDWKAEALKIAKAKLALDLAAPNGGTRGTLNYYAEHVETELRRLGIKGARGEWLTAENIKREALQGKHWWNGGHPKA